MPTTSRITDIWFRSALPLAELASMIGLTEQKSDVEDNWVWVVGYLDGIAVDVARQQSESPKSVDTRILRLDLEPFSLEQREAIISGLRTVVSAPISCGRWIHLEDGQYDFQVDEVV